MNQNSTYKKIFKGTFIFGGVQFFQILVSLIRGKTTAYFIGPEGIGLSNLLTSSLAIIITIAGLGCNMSCVKHIAALDKESTTFINQVRISQRIFKFIGFLGFSLCIALSPLLSYFSFSSSEKFYYYIFLSIYVFFSLYGAGLSSIFQGLYELKIIAKGNIINIIFGLIISIILYFLFGEKGVIPVIILSPIIIGLYFHIVLKRKYINQLQSKLDSDEEKSVFKEYVSLGITMVLATLLGNISTFVINSFISSRDSVATLGLYNAGMSITNQYIGLLFSAMGTDFFPRLSAVSNDIKKTNEVVNQQGEIIVLIAFPLLSLMIITAPILIKMLLSDDFLMLTSFIKIVALGMFIKVISFSLGYISFSKGDKKIYLFIEGILSNILMICLYCFGFYFKQLEGIAFSILCFYFIYLILIYLICRIRYSYKMSFPFFILSLGAFIVLFLLFVLSYMDSTISIIIQICVVIVICCFSLIEIEKRIGIKSYILNRFKKK